MLQRYNDAFPGCAQRIVAMAEEQSSHRMTLERTVVEGNVRHASRGQAVGAVVSMLALIGAFGLLYTGKDAAGYITLVSNLLLYGGAYVFAKKKQKKELEDKSQEPPR